MLIFFKSRRRKIGLAVALLACTLTATWIRGYSTVDLIEFPTGERTWQEWAFSDGIIRCWIIDADAVPKETLPNVLRWRSFGLWGLFDKNGDKPIFRWLENRRARYKGPITDWKRPCSLFIPFWSIVGPLDLICIWLLFSRPRQPQLNSIVEPTPTISK